MGVSGRKGGNVCVFFGESEKGAVSFVFVDDPRVGWIQWVAGVGLVGWDGE